MSPPSVSVYKSEIESSDETEDFSQASFEANELDVGMNRFEDKYKAFWHTDNALDDFHRSLQESYEISGSTQIEASHREEGDLDTYTTYEEVLDDYSLDELDYIMLDLEGFTVSWAEDAPSVTQAAGTKSNFVHLVIKGRDLDPLIEVYDQSMGQQISDELKERFYGRAEEFLFSED